MRKLAVLTALTVVTTTLWTQSGFTQPTDEVKALRKDIEALNNGQTAIQQELQEIKTFLGVNPKGEEARQAPADTRGPAAVGGPEEPRRPPGDIRGGGTVGNLDKDQRATLVRALAAQPPGTPVWFAVAEQDAVASELGRALRAAFAEAGWVVRGTRGVPFPWHPGIFLFAADEEPPAYVQTAQEALELAGIPPTVATRYRSYYTEMRTKPGWRGFQMAPDQTYLVIIGPLAQGPRADSRGVAKGGGLDDGQRAALVRVLAAQPPGTPVWFAVSEQDAAARELGLALRAAFTNAGWVVRGMRRASFAVRPGVFLFAADHEPPAYVATVQEALQLAGIPPTVATGYRSYYAEMRTKPDWRGFEMAPDQTYLV